MVKIKRYPLYRKKRENSSLLPIGDSIYSLLERMGGSRPRSRLSLLWQNWPQVVGEEIAAIASPAGYKGDTLVLSAADSMLMQEISMQSEEILQKINAWLQKNYFIRMRIILAKDNGELLSEKLDEYCK